MAPLTQQQAERRLATVRKAMTDEKLDAVLLVEAANVRWLSGYAGEGASLMVTRRWAGILVGFRNVARAAEQTVGCVVLNATRRPHAWREEIRRRRIRTIGLESRLTHAAFQQRRKALRPARVRATDLVRRCRAVKDPAEIALLRRAQRDVEKVLDRLLGELRPGLTEHQVHNRIIQMILDDPALDGPSFPPICASGPSAWATHSYYTERRIRRNDCVILDLGVRRGGYCSDMTRTVFLGRPTRAMREVYGVVWEAQQRAIEAIRPGAAPADVHQAAHQVLEAHGYSKSMGHGLGHGIGLEVHEQPTLGRAAKGRKARPLEAGMLVTVEPGIYLEGRFGVRIEDTVLVTPRGCENLTRADKSLTVLG